MGKIIVLPETTKEPITLIGKRAGICWGADISDDTKNYNRGLDCIKSNHGRTLEYVNIELVLDGYSARAIREYYTHIAGSPTRLQASTRYINYQDGFDYFTPPSIENNKEAKTKYDDLMKYISTTLIELEDLGIPREDSANGLPLGMMSTVVCKHNFRNLADMSHQRECTRAYHEYRKLFKDICVALSKYSEEWKYLVENYFMPKCDLYGYCTEKKSCGRKDKIK